jgi:two-component system, LuxR family, sensor kinase FixL
LKSPLAGVSATYLFNEAADAMLFVDAYSTIISANVSALTMFEYRAEQLIGLKIEALIPQRFHHHHHHYKKAFYQQPEKRSMGKGQTLFGLTQSGQEIAIDIGLSPFYFNDEHFILVTFYHAEKRHRMELALRASEERLRLAKKSANLSTFDIDPKTQTLYFDRHDNQIWDSGVEQPIHFESWFKQIQDDDLFMVHEVLGQAAMAVNGGEFKVEYRIKPLSTISLSNASEQWVSMVGRMHFKDGEATRLIGVMQDITEHKQFEASIQSHHAEVELIYKQQIASHTASAIAHELNQPLAAISAYSDVALHAINTKRFDSDQLKRALEGCIKQSQRAGASLHELLAFLQQGDLQTEDFDLNQIVDEAIHIAKADGLKGFQPIKHLTLEMPFVVANRNQVLKVLVNLLRNAVEAMQGIHVSEAFIKMIVTTNQTMNMAHLTVQDSGPGINETVMAQMFEPFFTTKPTGIGMGLVISRALIEANGGQLWVEPNSPKGATFHFTLPFVK